MVGIFFGRIKSFVHRSISSVLIVAHLFQVIAFSTAEAASITPDQKHVSVDVAPNNVPIVNIATPDQNGVSHNLYRDFNVGTAGAILNNSAVRGSSNLSGEILGNPNIKNANNEAALIINEVTGGGKSLLAGYTEIFGKRANYILANPNGITCDGCGFINTGRLTLSTGRVKKDEQGLYLLDVEKGAVTIEQTLRDFGLDATDADYFDIVSRTAQINGELWSKDVQVLAGRQSYDYENRITTAKADDGKDKPKFSIDSSALGGLYANKITLVGTEAGVGVRTPKNMAAYTGNMRVTADGQLVLNSADVKQGDLIATSKSQSISIAEGETLQAQNKLTLSAKQDVHNHGTVSAKQVDVSSQSLQNEHDILASETLKLRTDMLTNNGYILGKKSQVTASDTLTNHGIIGATKTLDITTQTLENHDRIFAQDAMNLKATTAVNTGHIQSLGDLTLALESLLTSGRILGTKTQIKADDKLVNHGTISATETLNMTTKAFENHGDMLAQDAIKITAKKTVNRGRIQSLGDLTLALESLLTSGRLLGAKTQIKADNQLVNHGTISATETLDMTTKAFENHGDMLAQDAIKITSDTALNEGRIQGQKSLSLMTLNGDFVNGVKGIVLGGKNVFSGIYGELVNHGIIESSDSVKLKVANKIENKNTGSIYGGKNLTLQTRGNIINHGHVESQNKLTTQSHSLFNHKIMMAGSANINTDSTFKNDAKFLIDGSLLVVANTIINRSGVLASSGAMSLKALRSRFENSDKAFIYSGGDLTIETPGHVLNRESSIMSAGALYIGNADDTRAKSIDNLSGKIQTLNGQKATLRANHIENKQRVSDQVRKNVQKSSIRIGKRLWIETLHDQVIPSASTKSEIFSSGDLDIDAEHLSNNISYIVANGDIILNGESVLNRGLPLTGYKIHHQYHKGKKRWCRRKQGRWTHKPQPSFQLPTTSIGLIQAGGNIVGNLSGAVINQAKADLSSNATPNAMPNNTHLRNLHTTRIKGVHAAPMLPPTPQTSDAIEAQFSATIPGFSAIYTKAAPDASTVFESRSKFLDEQVFLTSNYFYDRAGFRPDSAIKSLGSPALEQDLIRQQILQQTGRAYLSDTTPNDATQTRELMDAGAKFAKAFKLAPNVTMSAELAKNLTQDMILYEQRMIDNTPVVVPVVHLSDATRAAVTQDGAVISGHNVALKAKSLTNDHGRLEAQQDAHLTTTQDFTNRSGSIDVGRDLNVTAGSIRSETDVEKFESKNGRNRGTVSGLRATLSSGRHMRFSSDGTSEFAATTAKAGGGFESHSKGDQSLPANTLESAFAMKTKGHSEQHSDTDQDTTDISGRLGVHLGAGGRLYTQGAHVSSAQGKVTTHSGGETVLDDAVSEHSSKIDDKKSGSFGRSSRTKTERQSVTSQGTTMSGAKGVTHHVEHGDLTMVGATEDPGTGELVFDTPNGQVNLLAAQELERLEVNRKSKTAAMQKAKQNGHSYQTWREVNLGKAPQMTSGQKIFAEITANGDSQLKAMLKDIDAAQFAEVYDDVQKWSQTQRSLSPAAGIVVAIAITVATYGAGVGAGSGAALGMSGFAAGAVDAAAAGAVAATATQGVNHVAAGGLKGLRNIAHKDSLKSIAVSTVTAAVTAGGDKVSGLMGHMKNQLASVVPRAAVQSVIGGEKFGKALKQNLKSAPIDALAAAGAEGIGHQFHSGAWNGALQKAAHAGLGGGMAALRGEDVAAGAAGAMIGEFAGEFMMARMGVEKSSDLTTMQREMIKGASQIAAGLTVKATGHDMQTATNAAGNAVEHNLFWVPVMVAIGVGLKVADVVTTALDAKTLGEGLAEDDQAKIAEGAAGLAISGATSAIPGAKAGISLAKAGVKKGMKSAASEAGKASTGTVGKTVVKAGKKEASQPVHGNSLKSKKETHVYYIKNEKTGEIVKFGESSAGKRKSDGASIRGATQARKFTRETKAHHRSRIRKTFPNKAEARKVETKYIKTTRKIYGKDKLPRNKNNR